MSKLILNRNSEKNILKRVDENVDVAIQQQNVDSFKIERQGEGDALQYNVSVNHNYLIDKGVASFADALYKMAIVEDKDDKGVVDTRGAGVLPKVAFFCETYSHYTGGRYAMYFHALMLSHFVKVDFYTNMKPPFVKDLKEYETDNFKLHVDSNFVSHDVDCSIYTHIVGSPIEGGETAARHAKKYNKQLLLYLFESPNWIKEYREDGGSDSTEEFWSSYKRLLAECDGIITISNTGKKYITRWLGIDKKIYVVNPAINERCAKKSKRKDNNSDKLSIVFSSRSVEHKNQAEYIRRFDKSKYCFHIVGKTWNESYDALKKKGYDITLHGIVTDKQKFEIIRSADAMIYFSRFEGFGVPPLEAVACDIPVVMSKLPLFTEEIYNGYDFEYIDVDYEKDLSEIQSKVEYAIESFKGRKKQYKRLLDRYSVKQTAKRLLAPFGIPQITTGTIVYNCAEYLSYAIESIYNIASQIIIVEGKVEGYGAGATNSEDGTIDIVKALLKKDVLNKIEFVSAKEPFKNKIQMQNEIAQRVTGQYYIKVDADEINNAETLYDAIGYLQRDNSLHIVNMPFNHYWLSFNMRAVDNGGKWSTKHPRIWRWKNGYQHTSTFNRFSDASGNVVVAVSPENGFNDIDYQGGDVVHHFGYVRKLSTLQEKIDYYKNRGIENYVIDTVTNWSEGKPTQPTQKGASSKAIPFDKDMLPDIMKKHAYFDIEDVRVL